ncbi:unnamed protein product [Rhodiola kirilowii]
MAHLGGGAEVHARFNQYRVNSSLVLTTDSRLGEPTGEPELLNGKIDPKTFGDGAYRGRPAELDEKLKELDLHTDQPTRQEESVYKGVYQPKTTAYEEMLSVIDQELGGQPPSVVSGAVDEILVVLKNESLKKPEKKREIEKLLSPINNTTFDRLVSIGRRLITNYKDGGDGPAEQVLW